jgi:hydroxypyruvate isomerase
MFWKKPRAAFIHDSDPKVFPGQTPNTQFAVNVEMWWSHVKPFTKRLEYAANLGFKAVEFWSWRNKDVSEINEVRQRLGLEITQMTAWGFFPSLHNPKNHNRFLDEVEASCEVAKLLNCDRLTVVGGDNFWRRDESILHDNIISALNRAAPIAEKHKITLMLEPMNVKVDHRWHCLYGSGPALKIIRTVNSPYVKLNWDLYHMYITEGELLENLRYALDCVAYLQVADYPGRNEPGTGEIDFTSLLKGIRNLGYTDYIGLEFRPKRSEREAALAVYKADCW